MDIEKTMQFILETQARLEAVAGQHEERLTRIETAVSDLATQVAGVTDLVGRLAQAELRLVERMDQLAASQAHTDQRLDILVDVVDKLMRRKGSPQ
ncbi:MAG TPA: hypothetical protein VGZ29_16650 [Terriglobia bacterium]|nr:hypothetical protein [Terriglobia bacterium]